MDPIAIHKTIAYRERKLVNGDIDNDNNNSNYLSDDNHNDTIITIIRKKIPLMTDNNDNINYQ